MYKNPWSTGLALAAILVISSGCKDEKKPGPDTASSSSEAKKPALDPALAQAVASASAGSGAAQNQQSGPPENGVFSGAAADREMAKGAPPRFTKGPDGTEPRITLGSMLPPRGPKSQLRVRLAVSSGGRGVPWDFRLMFDPVGAPPKAGDAGPNTVDYVARLVGVDVDGSQVAVVDPKTKTEIAKLRGSKIRFKLAPNGAGSDFVTERAPTASADLEETLRNLSELLATILLPYPETPVGAGAYWMASTRETLAGIDTVAYRMVSVDKVEGNTLSLKVESKRYAVGDSAPNLPGLPPNAGIVRIEQFKSLGQGTLTITKGSVLPSEGKLNQDLLVILSMSSQPGQPGILQAQMAAVVSKP